MSALAMTRPRTLLLILAVLSIVVLAGSIRYGAIDFSLTDIYAALRSLVGGPDPTLDQRIFLELRLP